MYVVQRQFHIFLYTLLVISPLRGLRVITSRHHDTFVRKQKPPFDLLNPPSSGRKRWWLGFRLSNKKKRYRNSFG